MYDDIILRSSHILLLLLAKRSDLNEYITTFSQQL